MNIIKGFLCVRSARRGFSLREGAVRGAGRGIQKTRGAFGTLRVWVAVMFFA